METMLNQQERATEDLLTKEETESLCQDASADGKLSINDLGIREAAFKYYRAGFRVLPVKQDKTPATAAPWGYLKDRPATEEEMESWFPEGTTNLIAVVCGIPEAGNLEPLDFDEKYNLESLPLIEQFKGLVDQRESGLFDKLVSETSQSGGWHLLYSVSGVVEGNRKLATRNATDEELVAEPKLKYKTLAETRGLGGYLVIAPSKGYKAISGDILNLPVISHEQREMLLECARKLDLHVDDGKVADAATEKVVDGKSGVPRKPKRNVLLPGDEFDMRGDYATYLTDAGWALVYTAENVQYWRRPGKTTGISATFNYTPNKFHVFSSNAGPFEPETSYSPFAVYTYLAHDGDFTKAATELKNMGYGTDEKLEYAERVLGHRYEFKYNIIKGITEYRKRGTADEFIALTDKKANSLYRELVHIGCTLPKDTLDRLLESDYVPDYDPFIEYFEKITPWDTKTDHIRRLAETIALKDPKQFDRWLDSLRRWLVATAACATGRKTNQTVLTLHGPQGGYKTTWLMGLLPTKFKAMNQYRISRAVNPDSKDSQISLAENFLINIDELDTMTRFDVGSLKSFITQDSVDVRRPYGRRQENLPRRASIVASVNRDDFLVDETGNRRFLIFDVDSVQWNHNIDMDLVYAQAYALLNQPGGFKYWFDDKEITEINKINSSYRTKSTEEEFIEKAYKVVSKEDSGLFGTIWVSAADVASTLNELYHIPINTQKVGKAMTALGFQKKSTNAGARYVVQQKHFTGQSQVQA